MANVSPLQGETVEQSQTLFSRAPKPLWTMTTAMKLKDACQSILKEINPEYSLEGPMLRLQYSGHLMQRADSLEKTLILGMTEGERRV